MAEEYKLYIEEEIKDRKKIKKICSTLDIAEADKIKIWVLIDTFQMSFYKKVGKNISHEDVFIKYDEYEQTLYKSPFDTPILLLWRENRKIVYYEQDPKQKEKLYKKYQKWTNKNKNKIIKEALLTIER